MNNLAGWSGEVDCAESMAHHDSMFSWFVAVGVPGEPLVAVADETAISGEWRCTVHSDVPLPEVARLTICAAMCAQVKHNEVVFDSSGIPEGLRFDDVDDADGADDADDDDADAGIARVTDVRWRTDSVVTAWIERAAYRRSIAGIVKDGTLCAVVACPQCWIQHRALADCLGGPMIGKSLAEGFQYHFIFEDSDQYQ